MHEYSLVEALLRRVEEEAQRRSAVAVRRVTLGVGELSGVECDLIATAFDALKPDTVCDKAALDVRRVPARWACPKCEQAPKPGEVLRCPTCNGPVRLIDGGEIVLEQLELEVP